MSWSLQLRNGDLVLDRGQFGQVSGAQKLVQDLRCHLLEHLGTDDLHPEFGSLIDGGTRGDGTYVEGVIGETDYGRIRSFIEIELNRIVNEHQDKQQRRAKQDRLTYNASTMDHGELLKSASVRIGMLDTVAVVQIRLLTGSDETRKIAIPLSF